MEKSLTTFKLHVVRYGGADRMAVRFNLD